MTKQVDRLDAAGLVDRLPDPLSNGAIQITIAMTLLSAHDIQSRIQAIGAKFDESILHAVRDLYRPSVSANAAGETLRVATDVSYGPAQRHKLDVYANGVANAPVVLFVHGGGFVAGDKRGDSAFYENLGRYFAKAGFVAVLMNYRLAPGDTWPSGAQDIERAVDWIAENAASHGGDAGRGVLFGQSAGASHAATYLFDPAFCDHASRHLETAILLSGVYDLSTGPLSGGTRAYFGEDTAALAGRSPINHVKNSRLPLLIGAAEFDPALYATQAFALAAAVTARDGQSPAFTWAAGHNHVSTVHSLGSVQDDVGQQLLAYLARHAAHRATPSR